MSLLTRFIYPKTRPLIEGSNAIKVEEKVIESHAGMQFFLNQDERKKESEKKFIYFFFLNYQPNISFPFLLFSFIKLSI